tara:strand:- start:973 stop:1104 length:132 start_codon:yes stop_codon:yes gene_type:complete
MAKIIKLKVSEEDKLRQKALDEALKMQDFLNKQIQKPNDKTNR